MRLGIVPALVLIVGLAGCSWDAAHDNPRDPYHGGNIEGRLLNRRSTGVSLGRVEVPQAGQSAVTDSAGRFGLYGLPASAQAESVWVRFAADSFAPDSARVMLVRGEIETLTHYLDGLPYLYGCSLTTHVYARSWPPEPLMFCRFIARAGDHDGEADVDSVWMEIPGMGIFSRLAFDPDQKRFIATLHTAVLPESSLEALVGQEVRFMVADRQGVTAGFRTGLTRIIYDRPATVFPAGGLDSLSGDTVFVWRRFAEGFPVRYHGEVVRIEGGGPAGVAASFDTPGWSDTTVRFSTSVLAPGEYYWTLEAIDALGNSSRSMEERFRAY